MCCLFLNLRQQNADLSPIFCCFSLPAGCPWRIFDCQTRMMLLTQSSVWYLLNRYPSAICTLEEKSLLSSRLCFRVSREKKYFLYVGIFYRWYEAHRDTFYIFILKWKDAYIAAIGFLLCVKASLSVFFQFYMFLFCLCHIPLLSLSCSPASHY